MCKTRICLICEEFYHSLCEQRKNILITGRATVVYFEGRENRELQKTEINEKYQVKILYLKKLLEKAKKKLILKN